MLPESLWYIFGTEPLSPCATTTPTYHRTVLTTCKCLYMLYLTTEILCFLKASCISWALTPHPHHLPHNPYHPTPPLSPTHHSTVLTTDECLHMLYLTTEIPLCFLKASSISLALTNPLPQNPLLPCTASIPTHHSTVLTTCKCLHMLYLTTEIPLCLLKACSISLALTTPSPTAPYYPLYPLTIALF